MKSLEQMSEEATSNTINTATGDISVYFRNSGFGEIYDIIIKFISYNAYEYGVRTTQSVGFLNNYCENSVYAVSLHALIYYENQ